MLSSHGSTPIGVSPACSNCHMRGLCLPGEMSGSEIEQFNQIVIHHSPLREGEYVFNQGSRSSSVYIVRSGSLKNTMVTKRGEEQVISFSMCGDIFGLDAMDAGHYRVSAIALEPTSVCSIPVHRLEKLVNKIPVLQRQLFHILSRKLEAGNFTILNFGTGSAVQKLWALLLNLSERHGICHESTHEVTLRMSRREIASYLGIAYETLSRLLTRLQEDGLIKIKHVNVVHILQPNTPITTLEETPRRYPYTTS